MTSIVPGVKSDGLKKVRHAIEGLLLVLCSWLLLKTINPKFVEIDMSGVTPLKIEKKSWSSLYSQIEGELNAFNVNMQQLQEQAGVKKEQIDELKNQWTQNQFLLEDPDIDPVTAAQLEAEQINLESQINNSEGQLRYVFDTGQFDAITQKTGPSLGTKGDFQGALKALDNWYKQEYPKLQGVTDASGKSAQQNLTDYKNYSEALVKINEQAALVQQRVIDYADQNALLNISEWIGGAVSVGTPSQLLTKQKSSSAYNISQVMTQYKSTLPASLYTQLSQKAATMSNTINNATLSSSHLLW
jgi:hypothetical protein